VKIQSNLGLSLSLNRPVGNITGVSTFNAVLGSKRFELLHELVPNATVIALLVNPNFPSAEFETRETQAAARTTLDSQIRQRADLLVLTVASDWPSVFVGGRPPLNIRDLACFLPPLPNNVTTLSLAPPAGMILAEMCGKASVVARR
jgi:ABC transporter substrate binding protein